MSEIISLALKARLPIIRITSDDPDNVEALLASLSTRPVYEATGVVAKPSRFKAKSVYFDKNQSIEPSEVDYDALLASGTTFVVVNPDPEDWRFVRDCGKLTPSFTFIVDQLSSWLGEKTAGQYAQHFGGMSLRDTIETVLLTKARDKKLTSNGINETRSYLGTGLAGLESLDTDQDDYIPPYWVIDWLETDAPLLEREQYRELWPKGFMLYGPTGTGKTELSRFVAKCLGIPLYRLDLGSIYAKWQGESERNLRNALSFVSAQGNSVFLLDEAEKLFGNDAVGQASLSTLLSMLLWWLQGESNRTITVMTSNNLEIIPPELYRPGRLDAVHEMSGLTDYADFRDFVKTVAGRMADKFGLDNSALYNRVIKSYSKDSTYPRSQASVVGAIRFEAKKMIVEVDHEKDD